MLGASVYTKYPYAGSTQSMVTDPTEAVLNRTWRPFLSVVGANGLPPIANAGNVLRPYTELKLSLRIPPLVDGAQATRHLKRILEADPPYGARVTFEPDQGATGWNAPASAPWLLDAAHHASQSVFGKPAAMKGGGGTIPFMGMLGKHYPQAQFLITGVLGPMSNAHGPNEFLHIAYGKRLTACVALVLERHGARAVA
jgi:acetylornithine deacetylase/succinyl-diaminopimelate desuccinylase-like protein